jgi:hypothetical protein
MLYEFVAETNWQDLRKKLILKESYSSQISHNLPGSTEKNREKD